MKRWSIYTASREFRIHHSTLARRIAAAGVEPGPGGKYSTLQICSAVFTAKEIESTQLIREQRLALERENQAAAGLVVSVQDLKARMRRFVTEAKRLIAEHPFEPTDAQRIAEALDRLAASVTDADVREQGPVSSVEQ